MRRNVLLSCATLALTLAGADALAQSNASRSPWMAAVEFGPHWHHDGSMATFLPARGASVSSGLVFGRDVVHLGALTLGAEASWAIEGSNGRVRQAFDTRLITNRFQAGVVARADLTSWLTPYARVVAGVANVAANLNSPDGEPLVADAWTFTGAAGAGVLLTSGAWFEGAGWRRGRVALSVEGGYQYALPATLSATTRTPTDEAEANDRLAARTVSLGTLNPSSAYLRITVGLRF